MNQASRDAVEEYGGIPMSQMDKAVLVLHSQLTFLLLFWKEDFTILPERTDLPKEWQGRQILSEKQRIMICDRSKQVTYRTSRKIAKTILLVACFYRWTLWHGGRAPTDGLLHCPREHHLTNLSLRLEKKQQHTPLFNLLIETINRSKGVIKTTTGITWMLRIEGKTGTGESMVGPAALYEIGDEQDYADWGAFNERQAAILPGALRVLAGVPRGVQGGPFWSIANNFKFGTDWSVFRGQDGYNCFINPIYLSQEAKDRLIRDHGGEDTQAYVTQVLGLDGSKVFSSFPVIPAGLGEFILIEATGDDIDSQTYHADLARIPRLNSEGFIIAGDMGRSPSPTEIAVFRLYEGAWYQFIRVHLTITDGPQIAEAIHALNCALPAPAVLIGIDAHGQGTSPYDQLHKNPAWVSSDYQNKVIDVQFNSHITDEKRLSHKTCKRPVISKDFGWFCTQCQIPIFHREDMEPARVQMKQWAFTNLKDHFSSGYRLLTGQTKILDHAPIILNMNDEALIRTLEGTTEKETTQGLVQWESVSRHLVDMLLASIVTIERLGKYGGEEQAMSFLEELGWSGGDGPGQQLPWEVSVGRHR